MKNLFATDTQPTLVGNPLATSDLTTTVNKVMADGKPIRLTGSDVEAIDTTLQGLGLAGGALATPQAIVDACKTGTTTFVAVVSEDGVELRRAKSKATAFSSFDFQALVGSIPVSGKMLKPRGVSSAQLVVGVKFQIIAELQSDGAVYLTANFA